ncbi:hypothetical protein TIFTF001_024236 [Ficus carica]|uniref:Uncharacterized protein n=1 Tax=Ficus carica TaxID=3494 RepID=A0AA88AMZ9_FICCA|nr:hypothetical protein TIFTF001_024236 [Ficus carica]
MVAKAKDSTMEIKVHNTSSTMEKSNHLKLSELQPLIKYEKSNSGHRKSISIHRKADVYHLVGHMIPSGLVFRWATGLCRSQVSLPWSLAPCSCGRRSGSRLLQSRAWRVGCHSSSLDLGASVARVNGYHESWAPSFCDGPIAPMAAPALMGVALLEVVVVPLFSFVCFLCFSRCLAECCLVSGSCVLVTHCPFGGSLTVRWLAG